METLNKGDIEILTFGSFIGNHFVRENGKYVFQIEDSEMNRLGAKFDILEVFAIFKDNLLRDKYKIGRRENSSQPEIVPVQEEVKWDKIIIGDNENLKCIADQIEQVFKSHLDDETRIELSAKTAYYYFKNGINQYRKWKEESKSETAHLQQQLNTLTSEIKRFQEKYDENGYDCSNEIKLLRIENHIDFTLSFYHKEVTDLQQQLKEAKGLLEKTDDLLTRLEDYTHGKDGESITELRASINKFLTRNK